MDFFWDSLQWAFGPQWRWTIPVFLWLFLFFVSPWGLRLAGNEADRKGWIGFLAQDRGKRRYIRVMTRLLNSIDVRLSGPELEAEKGEAEKAWSLGLLNFTMLLAVAYPIISFVIQWLAGSPLRFGGAEIAPTGGQTARGFTGICLSASVGLYLFSTKSKPRWRLPLFICATVVLMGGSFLLRQFDVPSEVALAGELALAFAFVFAGAFAGALAFAFVFAGALAFALAFTLAFAFAFALVFAGALAFALAFASVLFLEVIENRTKTTLPRLIWLAIFLAAISITIRWFWQPDDSERAAYLIIFVGLFPTLNAVADFASVGLTRYLLRRGLNGLPWWKALWDTVGGIAIFALLGITAITWIDLIRPPNGQPLLNLTGLFQDLHTNPQDMWWLAIMLGSTLLPTAIHAAIGAFTLLLSYPEALRKWVIAQLDKGGKGSTQAAWLGGAALSAMLLASLWIPFLIGHTAFTANHGWLVKMVIAFFENYARLIGAI